MPEGYKTGCETTMWTKDDSQPTPFYPVSAGMMTITHPPITSIHRNSTAVVSSRREVLPFCGLHNLDELSVQPCSSSGFNNEPITFYPVTFDHNTTTATIPARSGRQTTPRYHPRPA